MVGALCGFILYPCQLYIYIILGHSHSDGGDHSINTNQYLHGDGERYVLALQIVCLLTWIDGSLVAQVSMKGWSEYAVKNDQLT